MRTKLQKSSSSSMCVVFTLPLPQLMTQLMTQSDTKFSEMGPARRKTVRGTMRGTTTLSVGVSCPYRPLFAVIIDQRAMEYAGFQLNYVYIRRTVPQVCEYRYVRMSTPVRRVGQSSN